MLEASKSLCSSTLVGLLSSRSVLARHNKFSPAEALLVQLLINVVGAATVPRHICSQPGRRRWKYDAFIGFMVDGSQQTLVLGYFNCLLLILRAQLGSSRA
jgi:hypothetical protein